MGTAGAKVSIKELCVFCSHSAVHVLMLLVLCNAEGTWAPTPTFCLD
jgi:hypothetical protein